MYYPLKDTRSAPETRMHLHHSWNPHQVNTINPIEDSSLDSRGLQKLVMPKVRVSAYSLNPLLGRPSTNDVSETASMHSGFWQASGEMYSVFILFLWQNCSQKSLQGRKDLFQLMGYSPSPMDVRANLSRNLKASLLIVPHSITSAHPAPSQFARYNKNGGSGCLLADS